MQPCDLCFSAQTTSIPENHKLTIHSCTQPLVSLQDASNNNPLAYYAQIRPPPYLSHQAPAQARFSSIDGFVPQIIGSKCITPALPHRCSDLPHTCLGGHVILSRGDGVGVMTCHDGGSRKNVFWSFRFSLLHVPRSSNFSQRLGNWPSVIN